MKICYTHTMTLSEDAGWVDEWHFPSDDDDDGRNSGANEDSPLVSDEEDDWDGI